MSPQPRPSVSFFPIFLLSAAGFTILTTEFVIVGLLPAMARDLRVTVSQAGLLVTLFAFTVAVVGPPLTAWLSRFDRKRLFVTTLLLFGLSNVLATLSPNIWVMAVARFIPAIMLPVFWSLASATAVNITGPAKAGKAISMVGFGIVVATILGIPIGTLISDAFGWRTAFASLAVLSFIKAGLLQQFLPPVKPDGPPLSVARQMSILRDPLVMGHVVLSLLVFAGMFTVYTYLADILERLAGFNGTQVGWYLMGFGGVGLLGNWLGGRAVDRSPLGATLLFGTPMVGAMLLLVPLVTTGLPLALILAVWGIAQSALFTASHVRVMKAAAETPALGASLNISGANLGIGLGAIFGGQVMDRLGLGSVAWAAALVVALAIITTFVLMWASNPARVRGAPKVCTDCE